MFRKIILFSIYTIQKSYLLQMYLKKLNIVSITIYDYLKNRKLPSKVIRRLPSVKPLASFSVKMFAFTFGEGLQLPPSVIAKGEPLIAPPLAPLSVDAPPFAFASPWLPPKVVRRGEGMTKTG